MGIRRLFVQDRSYFGDDLVVYPVSNPGAVHNCILRTFGKKTQSSSKADFTGIIKLGSARSNEHGPCRQNTTDATCIVEAPKTHSPSKVMKTVKKKVQFVSPKTGVLELHHTSYQSLDTRTNPKVPKKNQKGTDLVCEPSVKKTKEFRSQDSPDTISLTQESKNSSYVDVVGVEAESLECRPSQLQGHHEEWTFSSQDIAKEEHYSIHDDTNVAVKESPPKKFVSKFLRLPDSPISTDKGLSKSQPDLDIISSLDTDITEAADLVPYIKQKLLQSAQKQLASECRVQLNRIDSNFCRRSVRVARKNKRVTSEEDSIEEKSCQNWLLQQILPTKNLNINKQRRNDSVSGSFVFSLNDSDDCAEKERILPEKLQIHRETSSCGYDRKLMEHYPSFGNCGNRRIKMLNVECKRMSEDTRTSSFAPASVQSDNVSSTNVEMNLGSHKSKNRTTNKNTIVFGTTSYSSDCANQSGPMTKRKRKKEASMCKENDLPYLGGSNDIEAGGRETQEKKKKRITEDLSCKNTLAAGKKPGASHLNTGDHTTGEEKITKKRRKHTPEANQTDVFECELTYKRDKKQKFSMQNLVENKEDSVEPSCVPEWDANKNGEEKRMDKKKRKKEKSIVGTTGDSTSNSDVALVPVSIETDISVKRRKKKKKAEKDFRSRDKCSERNIDDILLDNSDLDPEDEAKTSKKMKKTKKKKKKEKKEKIEKEGGEGKKSKTEKRNQNHEEKQKRKSERKEKKRKQQKQEEERKKRKRKKEKRRKHIEGKENEGLDNVPAVPVHDSYICHEERQKKIREKIQSLQEFTGDANESVIILDGSDEVVKVKKRKKKKHQDETGVEDTKVSCEIRRLQEFTGDANESVIILDGSDEVVKVKKRKKKNHQDETVVEDKIVSCEISRSIIDDCDRMTISREEINEKKQKLLDVNADKDHASSTKFSTISHNVPDQELNGVNKRENRKRKLKLGYKSTGNKSVNAGTISSTSCSPRKQIVEDCNTRNYTNVSNPTERRETKKSNSTCQSSVSDSQELSDDFQPKPAKRKKAHKKSKSHCAERLMSPGDDTSSPWHRLSFDSNGPFTLQSEEADGIPSSGIVPQDASGENINDNEIKTGISNQPHQREESPGSSSEHILSPRPSSTVIDSSNEPEPLIEGRGNMKGLTQKLPSDKHAYKNIKPHDLSDESVEEVPYVPEKSASSAFQLSKLDDQEEAEESDSSGTDATVIEGRGNLRGLTQKISASRPALLFSHDQNENSVSIDVEGHGNVAGHTQNISPSRSPLQSSSTSSEGSLSENGAIELEGRGDLRGLTQHMPQSRIVSQQSSDSSICETILRRDGKSESQPSKSLKEMLELKQASRSSRMASRNSSVTSDSSFEQPSVVVQNDDRKDPESNSQTSIRKSIQTQSRSTWRSSSTKEENAVKQPRNFDDSKKRRYLDDSQYRCTRCQKSFTSVFEMCRHDCRCLIRKKVKPDSARKLAVPTHKCDLCGKSYIQRCHLLHHKRAAHEGLRPYACDYCGMRFSEKQTLIVHQRFKHTGVRPYECNYCFKDFFTTSNLHCHYENKHKLVKMFTCGKCEMSYFFRDDLVVHRLNAHANTLIRAINTLH